MPFCKEKPKAKQNHFFLPNQHLSNNFNEETSGFSYLSISWENYFCYIYHSFVLCGPYQITKPPQALWKYKNINMRCNPKPSVASLVNSVSQSDAKCLRPKLKNYSCLFFFPFCAIAVPFLVRSWRSSVPSVQMCRWAIFFTKAAY